MRSNSYMYGHWIAILRESTVTNYQMFNMPLPVLINLTSIIKTLKC
jgi:hypothetical protein